MATFSEMCALTSKQNVSETGMIILNLSEKLQFFWSHFSVFALEKQPEKLNIQSFLPLKETLVATFNETRAPTSRKYVAGQGKVMSNRSKTFRTFWFHSSVFALEKQT